MALTTTQKRALVDLIDGPARPHTAAARRLHDSFVSAKLAYVLDDAYHLTPLGLTIANLARDERRARADLDTARVESPQSIVMAESRWRSAGFALRQATASLPLGGPR